MEILYVTGNKGKVDLANLIYKDLDINVIQENMETPEIQSFDCMEVAKFSSKYAANLLQKPVLKNDSGLVIPSLNGFPGAFAKYAESSLKAEGFIKLLDGLDRKCYWVEALAYCEPNHEPVVFVSYTYGKIANEIHQKGNFDEYDRIFIPEGEDRTFSEMSKEEQLNCFDKKAYFDLYKHLSKHN